MLLSSILTAIVLYGAFHYTRYIGLTVRTMFELLGDWTGNEFGAAKAIVDYALRKETGYSGFIGYLLFKAQQGISIGKIYSSSRLHLGAIATWIYWLIEFGVIGYITTTIGKHPLKKPFCEFCNSWYAGKKPIGGVPADKESEILDLVKQNDFAAIGAMLEENSGFPRIELYLQSCPSCDKGNSFLDASLIKPVNGKLAFKNLFALVLKPEAKGLLKKEMALPAE